MQVVSLEYAALHCLNFWLAYDSRSCAALSNPSEAVQLSVCAMRPHA